MTRIDRRALFASGAAAALLSAAGVSAAPAPERGGRLRAALSGGDRSESWLTVPGGRFLQAARNAVFEGLTEIAADGTLQPGLARAWSSAQSGRVWRFDLDQSARFHDGAPLLQSDVIASLQAAGLNAVAGPAAVTVELDQPDPAFPFRLSQEGVVIFRADELESGALQTGTGLYSLVRYEPGRSFLGRRTQAHRKEGRAGWADEVEFIALSDEATRAEAVREGLVDVADVTRAHKGVKTLFDGSNAVAIMSQTVQHGMKQGQAPLDDMRFAERWWLSLPNAKASL